MTENLEGRQNLIGEFKGTGDNSHLGGCGIGGDAGTYYPHMWKALLEKFEMHTPCWSKALQEEFL